MKIGNAIFEWKFLLIFVAMSITATTAFGGHYVFQMCVTPEPISLFNLLVLLTVFSFWAITNIFVWLYFIAYLDKL